MLWARAAVSALCSRTQVCLLYFAYRAKQRCDAPMMWFDRKLGLTSTSACNYVRSMGTNNVPRFGRRQSPALGIKCDPFRRAGTSIVCHIRPYPMRLKRPRGIPNAGCRQGSRETRPAGRTSRSEDISDYQWSHISKTTLFGYQDGMHYHAYPSSGRVGHVLAKSYSAGGIQPQPYSAE